MGTSKMGKWLWRSILLRMILKDCGDVPAPSNWLMPSPGGLQYSPFCTGSLSKAVFKNMLNFESDTPCHKTACQLFLIDWNRLPFQVTHMSSWVSSGFYVYQTVLAILHAAKLGTVHWQDLIQSIPKLFEQHFCWPTSLCVLSAAIIKIITRSNHTKG